ncbi:MAG TPA: TolC family protein [Anaeromyxobacteraceae bacterium]|nr:TolC family protein [Anaeromyxobacteraceae bacterium]
MTSSQARLPVRTVLGAVLSASVLVVAGRSVAETPPEPAVRSMTLPEALAYAREHQPAVRAAMARVQASEADARATRARWTPYLAATGQLLVGTANNTTASYLGVTGVDLPRIGGTPVTASGTLDGYPSTLAAISLTQQVFDFGRVAADAALDDAITGYQRATAQAQEMAVALGVEESFFAVQAARSVLRASEEALQRAKVHRDQARAGVKAGLRPPLDFTRADADVARYEVGRVRAESGLIASQAALAAAVGIPEERLDASGGSPSPTSLPSLQASIRRSIDLDPSVKAAEMQVHAQEAATDAISARLRPMLLLSGSFSGREGGAPPALPRDAATHGGWVPDIPNWDVALVLRVPIFDWVTWKQVDASRQREEVRRAELDLVRQGQTAAVQRAWVAVDSARKAIVALEREVQASQENAAQADARFRAGLATIVELTDAEALRVTSEIQLALGRFDEARQRALLARLIVEEP